MRHRSSTGLGTFTRQQNATRPNQLPLTANVGHLDLLLSRRGKFVGLRTAQLRIAIRALSPNMGHYRRKLFVRASATHEGTQVMAICRKQASEQLAFRGDPSPRTRMAERLGDTGDHSDFTATVPVAPSHGGLAVIVWRNLHQRQLGIDAADNFRRRHHLTHLPAVAGADIHELDEAQNIWRTLEVPCHCHNVLIIVAALHYHVDLDRT